MSEPLADVLHEVREMGPTTVAEIAENVGLSTSTVRRLLKQLELAGKVESDNYARRDRVYMPTEETK